MTFEHLLAFNVALLAAVASQGPALLVAIRTTLGAGRAAGFSAGCGLAFMAATWTGAALLGLEAVFALFPWAYAGAKAAGAAYLLHVAWRMWTGARDPIEPRRGRAGPAFRQGLKINLLNPRSALFSAAVLVVIFPVGMTAAEKALLALNHLAVELVFYAVLALVMGAPAVSRRYLRAKLWIDRAASAVLGARPLVDR